MASFTEEDIRWHLENALQPFIGEPAGPETIRRARRITQQAAEDLVGHDLPGLLDKFEGTMEGTVLHFRSKPGVVFTVEEVAVLRVMGIVE